MSAHLILDQLLKSGMSLLDGKRSPVGGASSAGFGQLGTGIAAGGILGLLLGTKRGRSIGGSALKYGGVAALGVPLDAAGDEGGISCLLTVAGSASRTGLIPGNHGPCGTHSGFVARTRSRNP